MRFEQSPDIKYQDWVVYDEGLRYLGSLRPPPDGVWVVTGYWAYFGDDDPYCYLEISYDTWWLLRALTGKNIASGSSLNSIVYSWKTQNYRVTKHSCGLKE